MAEPRPHDDVIEADYDLMRRLAALIIGWIVVFFLASVVLVRYGDVLMDAFA